MLGFGDINIRTTPPITKQRKNRKTAKRQHLVSPEAVKSIQQNSTSVSYVSSCKLFVNRHAQCWQNKEPDTMDCTSTYAKATMTITATGNNNQHQSLTRQNCEVPLHRHRTMLSLIVHPGCRVHFKCCSGTRFNGHAAFPLHALVTITGGQLMAVNRTQRSAGEIEPSGDTCPVHFHARLAARTGVQFVGHAKGTSWDWFNHGSQAFAAMGPQRRPGGRLGAVTVGCKCR
mmetsp:Transcript_39631/g.65857  ORF Transcript_39631/g.65857 Transcript_39631/m.65857 type:complete len:230 (-) Transcript_39631:1546-2235(-)